jgi:hypothetical protein
VSTSSTVLTRPDTVQRLRAEVVAPGTIVSTVWLGDQGETIAFHRTPGKRLPDMRIQHTDTFDGALAMHKNMADAARVAASNDAQDDA